VPAKEALDEQVVLEQAAPAAPAQLAQGQRTLVQPFVLRSDMATSDRAADHQFLDLADRLGRVQALGADVDAVHDGVAAEQAVRVFEVVQALAVAWSRLSAMKR
jgi:hypothetical protein